MRLLAYENLMQRRQPVPARTPLANQPALGQSTGAGGIFRASVRKTNAAWPTYSAGAALLFSGQANAEAPLNRPWARTPPEELAAAYRVITFGATAESRAAADNRQIRRFV